MEGKSVEERALQSIATIAEQIPPANADDIPSNQFIPPANPRNSVGLDDVAATSSSFVFHSSPSASTASGPSELYISFQLIFAVRPKMVNNRGNCGQKEKNKLILRFAKVKFRLLARLRILPIRFWF